MPIIKHTASPHGVALAYHSAIKLDVDLAADVATVTVASHVDQAAAAAGKAAAWHWYHVVGADQLRGDDLRGSVEAALTAQADAPFYLGALVGAAGESIESGRVRRLAAIHAACQNHIVAGFESPALGAPHAYPAKLLDQHNLLAAVAASSTPGLPDGWSTPFWCAGADGAWLFAPHSAAQIQAVGRDAQGAIVAALLKNQRLGAAIGAADTQDQLDAITW